MVTTSVFSSPSLDCQTMPSFPSAPSQARQKPVPWAAPIQVRMLQTNHTFSFFHREWETRNCLASSHELGKREQPSPTIPTLWLWLSLGWKCIRLKQIPTWFLEFPQSRFGWYVVVYLMFLQMSEGVSQFAIFNSHLFKKYKLVISLLWIWLNYMMSSY